MYTKSHPEDHIFFWKTNSRRNMLKRISVELMQKGWETNVDLKCNNPSRDSVPKR